MRDLKGRRSGGAGARRLGPRRVRTPDSRHGHPIAPDRIGRSFEAARPNQVWLGDLSCVRTREGWLHLGAVLELHTRKIVGWAMRETARTAPIAAEALEMAVQRQRPAPGLICHTDRGVRYACEPYREALAGALPPPGSLGHLERLIRRADGGDGMDDIERRGAAGAEASRGGAGAAPCRERRMTAARERDAVLGLVRCWGLCGASLWSWWRASSR